MDVEAGAALQSLLFDTGALRLLGLGGKGSVELVLAFAVSAQIIEFFFQLPFSSLVSFPFHVLLQALLALTLGCGRYVYGGACLIPESAVSTATQLKLDVLPRYLNLGHHNALTSTDGCSVTLELCPVVTEIQRFFPFR